MLIKFEALNSRRKKLDEAHDNVNYKLFGCLSCL